MPIEKCAPTRRSLRRNRFSYSSTRVLLGRRQHVGLVAQRALAERHPHRRELLLVATHPHVPTHGPVGGPIDRDDVVVIVVERREPLVDLAFEHRQLLGIERVDHVQVTRSRTVRSLYRRRSRAAAKLHV